MAYELVLSAEPRRPGLRRVVGEALRGRRVVVLDAANCMDPYVLARVAHRRRLDRRLLQRVWISRAFTCHQLEELVRDRLPRVPADRVLVLDPGALLYDGEVAAAEAVRVTAQIVRRLQAYAAAPVAVTLGWPPPSHAGVFALWRDHAASVVEDDDGTDRSDVQPGPALRAGRPGPIPPGLEAGGSGGVR